MSRDNYIERQTLASRYAEVAAEYRAEGFEIAGWRPHSILEDHEGFDIWHKRDEAPSNSKGDGTP